jgi:glutamate carboxypeptidase
MVACLRDLVEIESPTTDKTAVDRVGKFLAAQAVELGAGIEIYPRSHSGDCLACRWHPSKNTPGILVLCHMDTVFDMGTLASMPFRRAEGKIFGPGVMDMKGGIVEALSVVKLLQTTAGMPTRPVTLLLTPDEETGSLHSRELIETFARQSEAVFCLEPALASGAIKTARKGTGDIYLETRGIAAHAGGNHDQGRNAIEELAHHILSAQLLTDYAKGTTVNVGIVSGGTRTNVVPDRACAELDFRVSDLREVDRLQAWADSLRPVIEGAAVQARLEVNRPPMPRDAVMARSFAKARALASGFGLNLEEASTGGGSDANFVAPLGVPVLDGLGPVGDGGHSEREFLWEDTLLERAALLAALVVGW